MLHRAHLVYSLSTVGAPVYRVPLVYLWVMIWNHPNRSSNQKAMLYLDGSTRKTRSGGGKRNDNP